MAIQYQNQAEIIKLYLNGKPISHIAKQYKVSPSTVTKIIESPEQRLEVEKKYFTLAKARENRQIDETKEKIISFIDKAIQEASEKEGKLGFMKEITSAISELDRISRLNSGEVTERTEQTSKNINYNISELLNNLKTDDAKKDFLRQQLK